MAAPKQSLLDANQCIQGAFDDETGRLRTDAKATIVNADIDVALDATEDSVTAWIVDKAGNAFTSANPLPVSNPSIDAVNTKTNNNYGVATGAIRTAAQIGNASGAANFAAGVTGAQTLRTTSNITRNGTELSYNTGASDINTLRVAANISASNGSDIAIVGRDPSNVLKTQKISGVDTLNSSSVPLAANATFTGGWVDIIGYANISIVSFSNVASAIDGLKFEFSTDGVNVDYFDRFSTSANIGNQYSVGAVAKYFRIRYTNGGTAQSTFRLQTVYHITDPKSSTHRIEDSINGQNGAELVKAVITGKNPDGDFSNGNVGGVVSSNSSTVPLGVGGTFQGAYFDNAGYVSSSFFCLTDRDGTMFVETSDDTSTIVRTSTFTLTANTPFYISQTPVARYTRVRVVNTSGVAQTQLRLQTMLRTGPTSPSAMTIASPLNKNSIALNSRSILSGQQENGVFSNVGLSNSSSIKVAITDRPSEVRNRVKVQGRIFATSLTSTATVLHTVTAGKTLYVESMIVSVLNNGNTIGEWRITDGATDRIGYMLGERISGSPAVSSSSSPSLPEPIPFTTNFGVREISGDILLSIYFIGYEE